MGPKTIRHGAYAAGLDLQRPFDRSMSSNAHRTRFAAPGSRSEFLRAAFPSSPAGAGIGLTSSANVAHEALAAFAIVWSILRRDANVRLNK
jgi:hypothetical protein